MFLFTGKTGLSPKRGLANSHSRDFSFPASISHRHFPVIQELGDPTRFIFFAILLPSCSKSRNFLPVPAELSQPRALPVFAQILLFQTQLLPIPSSFPFSSPQPFPAALPRTATLTINNRAATGRKMGNKSALIGQERCQVSSCPFSIRAQPGSHPLSSGMLLLEIDSKDFGVIHTLGRG